MQSLENLSNQNAVFNTWIFSKVVEQEKFVMRYFKEDGALVIKSWCNNPEEGAIEQAKHLARLPFAFK